jgi:hypothetical protein
MLWQWVRDLHPEVRLLYPLLYLHHVLVAKAGFGSNKTMVGVPSYGGAFGMTLKSCTGPECTYTRGYDESTA